MTRSWRADGAVSERVLEAMWDLWSRSGRFRMKMRGSSMRPAIREGSELIIEQRPQAIRIGDVVVYRLAGQSVAHRVVGIRRTRSEMLLTLKGDRARGFDPTLPLARILGRVVGNEKTRGFANYDSFSWRIANAAIACSSATIGRVLDFLRKPGSGTDSTTLGKG